MSGCAGLQQRDPFGDQRVDVERFRVAPAARSANSENARTRRSSESISLTTICAACSMNARSAGRLPREHLLDGQADRRQRVLQLVRRLSRERLPARHLRQVHEPLAALPQLLGHVVERVDGASDFVARRAVLDPRRVPVAGRKVGEARGELPGSAG